nr:hypothetical protein [Candidatus Njordarchaeum guaymaensis]
MIGAVLRLFANNAARVAYLVMERRPFIVFGEVPRNAINGLSAFCPNRVLRELEGDEVVSSSLKLLKNFVDAERNDPSANRFFLTAYDISAETAMKLHSTVPMGWIAVLSKIPTQKDSLTEFPVFDASSSIFRGFPTACELDYEFSLIRKVTSLLEECDEATADEFTRLEQKDFYDKAKAFRTLITKSAEDAPERFVDSLLRDAIRFDMSTLQVSKILSLLRSEHYDNLLSTLESKLGPSYRERLISELSDRTRKLVPLDPLSVISLPNELVPVAKAMAKLCSASVDEVAREIRKRKGATFKLLEELRESGYLTLKRTEGKIRFSIKP